MLQNMHIKNIVLIDEIDVNFNDRLNILTGETGAGKSIIIGSLGICLGGRFHKELLRDENRDGLVELLFSVEDEGILSLLSELGIDTDSSEILISRKLSSSGKTVSRINGNTVTTATLKNVAGRLIDLHAQHEQQTLLKEHKHLEILDRFGGEETAKIKEKVKDYYKKYSDIRKELESITIDATERNRQADFLKYQIEEIDNAALKSGEDEELEVFYKKASNSREILSVANEIYGMTGSKTADSSAEQIGHSVMLMKRLADLDGDLSVFYQLITNIEDLLSDFNIELKSYMKSMEFDDREFIEAENRLNLINSLKSKYGNSIEAIQNSKLAYVEEYNKLQKYDEYVADLKIRLEKAQKDLEKEAEVLSKLRKSNAKKLCRVIREAMEELNFMEVKFEMEFSLLDNYTEEGIDSACFMISTNVGEPLRPLSEIASGGELSRVMLAIKSCLASEDDTPTLIFDEIDVGISGRTAQKVAERLSVIASRHQVICITHLPQIAAMADTHYLIEKTVENNKTITNIRELDKDAEIDEIARLLGGAMITEATVSSAKDMKGLASKAKLY